MQSRKFALFDALMGIVVLLASLCCNRAYAQDVPTPPVWPIPEWQTSTPEAQGMDSADLAKLVAYGKTKSFDSLLLARHGRIVLDAYYAPYAADIPHAINSSTKAVVGTLTAMLLKDGLLDSLDHPVLDFFVDRDIANAGDHGPAAFGHDLWTRLGGRIRRRPRAITQGPPPQPGLDQIHSRPSDGACAGRGLLL